jgi:catechol 2,3-dioxygenase-like lactoylglutathione lyase family enzyme
MIEGIDSITYGIPDVPEHWMKAKHFLLDWGLVHSPESNTGFDFETLNESRVHLVSENNPDYPPAIEAGATLRRVTWGVTTAAELARLDALMQGETSYAKTDAGFAVCDPHGLQLCFQLSQKQAVDVKGSPSNPFGAEQRINQPSPVYDRAKPVEIGHVVLFSDCLLDAEAFYHRLGFTTSDRYPNRGIFMRCSPTGGHHDVFLLQIPGKSKGLNHVAFTVRDIHEVFGGGLHMSRCGWKTQLGPGRHPISSAYFWYFENPCGGLIEYNADEDHLTADWQAREHTPSATAFAEWAIEGGIDGNTRRQPNVEAGGKFLTEKR